MSATLLKTALARISRYQRAGRFADALAEVERVLKHSPWNTRMLVLRSMLIQLLDEEEGPDLEEAKHSLLQAVQSDSRAPEPLIELGCYLFAVEDKPHEALRRFQAGARLAQELLSEALVGMASCFLELDKPHKAFACLGKASWLNDGRQATNADAWHDLAEQLTQVKHLAGK